MAYVECMDNMIKLMTERGLEATVSILAETKAPLGALASFIQTVHVELSDVSLAAGKDREVGSR